MPPAARLTDQIEVLEEVVEREGRRVTSPNRVMRAHPVPSSRAQRALPRVLAGIVIAKLRGKNPAEVKAGRGALAAAQRGERRPGSSGSSGG